MPKESSSSDVGDYRHISITPDLSKVYEKIMVEKGSPFLEDNSLLSLSQFLYRRVIGTYDALFTVSHYLQVALDGALREGLFSWTSQLSLIGLFIAGCCKG